jgi:hypothetical protein
MTWKLAIATVILLAVPASGGENLRLSVSPTVSTEARHYSSAGVVEPHDDNRSIQIQAESAD